MDWQPIAIGLLSVLATIGGWVINRLFHEVDELRRDQQRTELESARRYVDKSHMENFEKAVFEKLDKISEDMKNLAVQFAGSNRTGI